LKELRKIGKRFSNVITAKSFRGVTQLKIQNFLKVRLLVSNNETKTVITAATNVRKGSHVPFAKVGAKIGDGRVIERRSFEHIVSEGILCSYSELGLEPEFLSNEERNGIFILPYDTPLFKSFEDIFPVEDTYLDFSLCQIEQMLLMS